MQAWEDGRGDALYRIDTPPYLYLFDELLDLVLPRVTTVQIVGRSDRSLAEYRLKPPVTNWRNILAGCHDFFITNPIGWGAFAEYTGTIENLLLSTGISRFLGSFNSRFQERFTSFDDNELQLLHAALRVVAQGHETDSSVVLTPDQAAIIQKAQELAGDLTIGGLPRTKRTLTIGSIALPKN